MHLHLLFFGSPRYLPLLHRLVGGLAAAGCALPWSVLTDAAGSGALPSPWPRVVVDPTPFSGLVRVGNQGEAFDRKSTYLLALMQQVQPGPFAVLDCDNVVEADPAAALLGVPAGRMAMAECPDDPPIPLPDGPIRRTLPERTSALMVFPADAREYAAAYERLWRASVEPTHYLLEQRTWSLVWHALEGHPLPRTLSWSRFWGPPPPGTLIRHLHGVEKWDEMQATAF